MVFCLLFELNVSGETLNETLKLTKENEAKEYQFGVWSTHSKTIAGNARLLVIGSPKDMKLQGSVDIFSRKQNKRIAKLRPPSSSQRQYFGWCVAVNDDFIVVGAWGVNRVYVYNASDPFELLHTLSGGGRFGWSCSIDQENTLVVGAPIYNNRRGAVFVYKLNNLLNEPMRTLQPNDFLVGDRFGDKVAITTNYIAAGTPDKGVYVFDKITDRVCKVEPQNEDRAPSLAINDGRLFVGESSSNTVFIYTVNSSNACTLRHKVHRNVSDTKGFGGFGHTLAVSGNIMVVCNIFAESNKGICYLYMFEEGDDKWRELATLRPSDGIEGDYFGVSLAMDDGGTVIVGSRGKSQGYEAGAVYLYGITNFTQRAQPTTTTATTQLPTTKTKNIYVLIISLISICIVAVLCICFVRHRRIRQRSPIQQNEMEAIYP